MYFKQLCLRVATTWLAFCVCLPVAKAQDTAPDSGQGTQFICPVGGEEFQQFVDIAYYPLEGLPNGSSPGGNISDIMVPVCPSNGLAMVPAYDGESGAAEAMTAYTPEELTKLPALIASPEYKALAAEAKYLRLYWLAGKLGRPSNQRFHLLQHVSWIGATPKQHRAYLERFVREGGALIDSTDFDPARRTRSKFFIANALRELGRFDEAQTRLAELRKEWDNALAEMARQNPEDPNFEDEETEGDGFGSSIAELLGAIADHDDDYFPVSMMGDKWAAAVCRDLDDSFPPATKMTKRGCEMRKARKAQQESEWVAEQKLSENPAKLAQLCKATPEDKRDTILNMACATAEYQAELEKMEAESARLLKNPAALDPRCVGMEIRRYATPKHALAMACQKRREAANDAKQIEYVVRFEKNPKLVDQLCTMEYPQYGSDDPLEAACAGAVSDRNYRKHEAELTQLKALPRAELEVRCKASDVDASERSNALQFACADLVTERETAERAAWQASPAKLAAACDTSVKSRYSDNMLERLCGEREENRLDVAARNFAYDRPAMVSMCKATPHLERSAEQARACESYLKCILTPRDSLIDDAALAAADFTEERYGDGLLMRCYDSLEDADNAAAKFGAAAKTKANPH